MTNLRKAARGAPCFLWLPGCSPGPDNETVVLCHRKGAGIARKSDDDDAVLGCARCHAALDGAESSLLLVSGKSYDAVFAAALKRTQRYWSEQGFT